jgi:carbon monoxide dehydrogenase subunit G
LLIENSFEVPANIDHVWAYLLDVERVVVCMPGAELTETIDESNWKGKVKIKLGPVSLSFAGKVTLAERDDDAHKVILKGSGMEQRGKGRAAATVTTTAEQTTAGTRINVVQDLEVQGQVASMSRGMMKDVSTKLTKQFAECLEANLRSEQEAPVAVAEAETAAAATAEGAAAPVPGTQAGAPAAPVSAPSTPPVERRAPASRGGEVKGLSLLVNALWGAVRRFFGRLFSRRS